MNPPNQGAGHPYEDRHDYPPGVSPRHDQLAQNTGDQPDYYPDYKGR